MHSEWLRFKSFELFPIASNARPLRLAQNGFYYQGNGEEAKCSFCGVVNATWPEGETVNEIHTRLSRTCPFVSGQKTANVPIHAKESLTQQSSPPSSRTRNNNNGGRSSNDNNRLTASARSKTAKESNVHQQEYRSSYLSERSKYPQYLSRETRLESFTSWGYSHIVTPQDLCDAGLFFVGNYPQNVSSYTCTYKNIVFIPKNYISK